MTRILTSFAIVIALAACAGGGKGPSPEFERQLKDRKIQGR